MRQAGSPDTRHGCGSPAGHSGCRTARTGTAARSRLGARAGRRGSARAAGPIPGSRRVAPVPRLDRDAGLAQGGAEVLDEARERSTQRFGPTDHDQAPARRGIRPEDRIDRGAKPPACPVPRHRVADLATGGEPYAAGTPEHVRLSERLEHETRHRGFSSTPGDPKELRAFEQARQRLHRGAFRSLSGRAEAALPSRQAESFLRPLARRLARMLRPPTVAVRLRKPCRRLRTSFEGW